MPENDTKQRHSRAHVMLRASVLVAVVAVSAYWLATHTGQQTEIKSTTAKDQAEDIPAFGKEPPSGPLPTTLPPDQFSNPDIRKAYAAAGRLKTVFYQLPCYCRCDHTENHKHLLDCFRSYHGAHCWACQREALFAEQEFKKGRSPTQIRDSIISGAWR